MRPLRLAILLAAVAACHSPRQPIGPEDLPHVIPLPASFRYGSGTANYGMGDFRFDASNYRIEPGAPESYRLDLIAGKGPTIVAADSAGLFYARQTLDQLLAGGGAVRDIHIEDAPRFRYRGMHLDVARHFMPVAFVKRYIDLMSRYKMNTFHWHLTDDQGWRIEIKKYPRLTEIGGCWEGGMVPKKFNPNIRGGGAPCGF